MHWSPLCFKNNYSNVTDLLSLTAASLCSTAAPLLLWLPLLLLLLLLGMNLVTVLWPPLTLVWLVACVWMWILCLELTYVTIRTQPNSTACSRRLQPANSPEQVRAQRNTAALQPICFTTRAHESWMKIKSLKVQISQVTNNQMLTNIPTIGLTHTEQFTWSVLWVMCITEIIKNRLPEKTEVTWAASSNQLLIFSWCALRVIWTVPIKLNIVPLSRVSLHSTVILKVFPVRNAFKMHFNTTASTHLFSWKYF